MKNFLLCIIVLTSSVHALAQNPKAEKVKRFLELSGTRKLTTQTMSNMIAMYKTNYPATDSSFWNEFQKELKTDDLIDLMVPVYEKHFSDRELDALIGFYSTPTGQKIVETTPLISSECMAIGMKWGKDLGERVDRKMKERAASQ